VEGGGTFWEEGVEGGVMTRRWVREEEMEGVNIICGIYNKLQGIFFALL
jgi:hypothetical protein